MQIDDNFRINIEEKSEIKEHTGMGYNAILQLSIVLGINYMYGKRIDEKKLVNLLQKNYYEENKEGKLIKTYCSGVAHNVIKNGGINFINEKGKLIYNKQILDNLKIYLVKATLEQFYDKDLNVDKDELVIRTRKENDRRINAWKKKRIIRTELIPALKKDNYKMFFKGLKKYFELHDLNIFASLCHVKEMKFLDFKEAFNNFEETAIKLLGNSPNIVIVTLEHEKVEKILLNKNIEYINLDIDNTGIKYEL